MKVIRSHVYGHDRLVTSTGESVTADSLAQLLLSSGSFVNRPDVEREVESLFYLVEVAQ